MTRKEILNTPEIVDFMIDKSVMVDSKMKLHKRLEELCKLAIKALEQQPKTGHWINLEETKYKGQVLPFWGRYECSKCGGHGEGTFNYCPNCGAKMKAKEAKADDSN